MKLNRFSLPVLISTCLFCSTAFSADLLERIKEAKEITVATEARYAPFEYVDNGKIVGYDVDWICLSKASCQGLMRKNLTSW